MHCKFCPPSPQLPWHAMPIVAMVAVCALPEVRAAQAREPAGRHRARAALSLCRRSYAQPCAGRAGVRRRAAAGHRSIFTTVVLGGADLQDLPGRGRRGLTRQHASRGRAGRAAARPLRKLGLLQGVGAVSRCLDGGCCGRERCRCSLRVSGAAAAVSDVGASLRVVGAHPCAHLAVISRRAAATLAGWAGAAPLPRAGLE